MPKKQFFTDEQLREVWDDARTRGILYNGMTAGLLRDRFKVIVYHESGVGWYHLNENHEPRIS